MTQTTVGEIVKLDDYEKEFLVCALTKILSDMSPVTVLALVIDNNGREKFANVLIEGFLKYPLER